MSSRSNEIPGVTSELIQALERAFPDRAERTERTQFDYGRRAGAQAVIDRLRDQLRRDEEGLAASLEQTLVQAQEA